MNLRVVRPLPGSGERILFVYRLRVDVRDLASTDLDADVMRTGRMGDLHGHRLDRLVTVFAPDAVARERDGVVPAGAGGRAQGIEEAHPRQGVEAEGSLLAVVRVLENGAATRGVPGNRIAVGAFIARRGPHVVGVPLHGGLRGVAVLHGLDPEERIEG